MHVLTEHLYEHILTNIFLTLNAVINISYVGNNVKCYPELSCK